MLLDLQAVPAVEARTIIKATMLEGSACAAVLNHGPELGTCLLPASLSPLVSPLSGVLGGQGRCRSGGGKGRWLLVGTGQPRVALDPPPTPGAQGDTRGQ